MRLVATIFDGVSLEGYLCFTYYLLNRAQTLQVTSQRVGLVW